MTLTYPGPYTEASNAAAALLAAHPDFSAKSVDVANVQGLGPAALIQVENTSALRCWAQALNTTAHTTGASGYGTTGPHQQASLSEWLWWRMTFIDTTVDQMPVRLWTLDATDQRALATFLASTAHTVSAPSGDRAGTPNHPNTPAEDSR